VPGGTRSTPWRTRNRRTPALATSTPARGPGRPSGWMDRDARLSPLHLPRLTDVSAEVRSAPPGRWNQSSDMEQTVKGSGSVGGTSSRPLAADGPGRRRWVRLTFAGRDGMTGNRRELARSGVAGRRWGGRLEEARVLRVVGLIRCSGSSGPALAQPPCLSGWSVAIAQTNPGEFAGAADDDLLVGLAAGGPPPPALVNALLAAPGALDDGGVLAALAAGQLVADLGRRRAFQAASTRSRRGGSCRIS